VVLLGADLMKPTITPTIIKGIPIYLTYIEKRYNVFRK